MPDMLQEDPRLAPPTAGQSMQEVEMTWNQASFNEYMRHVRLANSRYERFRRSCIHAATELLRPANFRNDPGHPQSVQQAWNGASDTAHQRYAAAWQYVQQTLFVAAPVAAPAVRTLRQPPTGAIGLVGLAVPGAPAVLAAVTRDASVAARDHVVDEAIEQILNGDVYRWHAKFRLRFVEGGRQGQSVAVIVTIAAFSGNSPQQAAAVLSGSAQIPATHRGVRLTDQVKRNWKIRILERWSGAVFVVLDARGRDLETYDIDFDFNWTDDAANASQTVFAVETTDAASPPDGTINTMYWGVNDGGNTGAAIAHEFGYLVGNPDEYGACVFRGAVNRRDQNSVMDNEQTGQSKAGHYWLVGREIAVARGLLAANCRIRLGTTNYRVDAAHPWR